VAREAPMHSQVHYALGRILARRGDRDGARKEFEIHRRIQEEERQRKNTASTMRENE